MFCRNRETLLGLVISEMPVVVDEGYYKRVSADPLGVEIGRGEICHGERGLLAFELHEPRR